MFFSTCRLLRKRYHFPIQVPVSGNSKIRIGSDWIYFSEGQAFSFFDSVEHEVEHNSDGNRVLLIIDVWPESVPEKVIEAIKLNKNILKYGTEGASSIAIND